MPADRDQTDPFQRFLSAFPARDEPHDVTAAREAWARAIRRADSEAIIAGALAYARSREGQPARFTMSARRWLDEGRWRNGPKSGPVKPLVWIECGSPEWAAWTRFRGRTPPLDRRGGWRFPSRWPPAMQAAE
ncbi:MAG: hypothetical protein ACR652_07690 [Methylocystis sp.]|uniref:hypothetical protein n=1 Tax=Methylocystis sp. TaxID=1911079 RepID=UPI003DA4797F